MFDPLDPADLLRGLSAVLRSAGATQHDSDGLSRAQVMSAASVARLLAIEVDGGAEVRAALDLELLAALASPSPLSDDVASAVAGLVEAVGAGAHRDADAAVVALIRATRQATHGADHLVGTAVRAAIRSGIETETTVYAKEFAR
jgi:hypothetical protein